MSGAELSFPEDFYRFDEFNYRRFFSSFSEDLRTSYNRDFRSLVDKLKFSGNIIMAGSSWSVGSARIVCDYLKNVPRVFFAQDYGDLVNVSKDDLVIVISHSGDGEEANEYLKKARRVGAKSLIIAGGGRLKKDSFDVPVIDLVGGIPSRVCVYTVLGTLLRLFEDLGLIVEQKEEVQLAVDFLRSHGFDDVAIDLSAKLYGSVPVIYASPSLGNIFFRFKKLVNLCARATCFFGKVPSSEYFEVDGFLNKNASFYAVIFSSSQELSRVRKKVSVFKDALQREGISVIELNVKGSGLVRVVSGLILSDLSSYYLALRYKQNPLGDSVCDRIKKDMGVYIS